MNFKKLFSQTLVLLLMLIVYKVQAQTFSEQLTAKADVIVAKDGSGDFTTVQAAINSIPDYNDVWKVILVKKGTYYEKIILKYTKTKVILVGEDVDSTILTYDDWADNVLPGHTFSTYSFRADAHDFQAYNISFQTTAPKEKGQSVAFHSNGDRQILFHCRLLGDQDTYFDNFRTRRYIKDCFIEGSTDYIFGWGVTLFDSCQIHTSRTNGYITAASTPEHYEFGYVFKDCRLTTPTGVIGVSLGRPWFDYSNTIYFECWQPESINSTGWTAWSGREQTCVYKEYNCFGPGSDTTKRIIGKQLDPSKASRYTPATIFAVDNFPTELGVAGDTTELMALFRRFEASGYAERADTILYAGRDHYPTYPTVDWIPVYYDTIYSIVKANTLPFMDSSNANLTVENLYHDNTPFEDFNANIFNYVVEIPTEQIESPVLRVTGNGVYSSTTYPNTIPGPAIVSAFPRDKVNAIYYNVYVSKDSAYWNTLPEKFVINYKDTIIPQKGIYNYQTNLTEGETSVKSVKVQIGPTNQKYKIVKPSTIPGDAIITVYAPNAVDSSMYTINVKAYASSIRLPNTSNTIKISSVLNESLVLFTDEPILTKTSITLYNITGQQVFNTSLEQLNSGRNNIALGNAFLTSGIYIYKIVSGEKYTTGKIIKSY